MRTDKQVQEEFSPWTQECQEENYYNCFNCIDLERLCACYSKWMDLWFFP
jgi:hypothetical protein